MADLLRRYLQTRISLEEPTIFLPRTPRRVAVRRVRKLARAVEAGETRADPAPAGAEDEADAPAESLSSATSGKAEPSAGSGRERPAGSPGGAAAGSASAPSRGSGRSESDDGLPPEPPPIGGEPAVGPDEVERLSREATSEEIRELPDFPTLQAVAESCVRCPLHRNRNRVVFGEGSPDAAVVCVGEAPGSVEDDTGRPFVGPAGQLLDRLLVSVGFQRKEVFICNVLKCRPPGNRNPKPEEIEQCSPYLLRQIDLLEPRVIVAFGAFASRTLLEVRESIGRMRQQTHLYRGYPLVVTYHPAALLRNPGWTRPTWEDLQRVRRIVDGDEDVRPADSERLQQDVFDS